MEDPRITEAAPASPAAHATTTGMVGGGFYNQNSAPQMAAIAAILPWIDQGVATMDLAASSGPVRLADFGCSEGRNSIEVMRHTLKAVRRHTAADVQTIHSDLPTNDFSALTQTLRRDGSSIYGDPKVFSSVVPGSMYDQLCPAGSLDMAFSFNAIGFLSRRPVDVLPGYILPNGPSAIRGHGAVHDEDRAAFAQQAEADVSAFLEARATELKPGGKLVLEVFGGGQNARTCDGIYDLLNDAVRFFVEAGEIPEEVYARYYQPVYFRTLDELVAPLQREATAASQAFSLDRADTYEIPVSFEEDLRANGDIAAYSKAYVRFFRAFTESPLKTALADLPGANDLTTRIFAKAEELLTGSPELYPFRYVAVAAMMTRR
ncbi:S-adenosylmethionine-dependent carboxyl methyltransferase [Roseibium hamelinense]|uniref:S-adenosylmethionine-dependent carboxyl methyltransferase n=1 Tax=Roseibium hamelinense TaxID=150831 RepID=A0A562TBT6_9HYPH|nr:hypothetical protein [Roseibium hamelinense]MTI45277.1 hypothetical protein [Roseibium hamelinense]TWI90360.1 S-adenosylmethionine-dependent carboxyl methyltransferase [Roseibium hamelinense]